jgi:hypothetical protein
MGRQQVSALNIPLLARFANPQSASNRNGGSLPLTYGIAGLGPSVTPSLEAQGHIP